MPEHPSACPADYPALPIDMVDLVEAAVEVWSPCGEDPRWCWVHNETPPCPMAALGYMLTAIDGTARPQPWDERLHTV